MNCAGLVVAFALRKTRASYFSMKNIFIAATFIFIVATLAVAQVPTDTLVKIVKAEDARGYDKVLEDLLHSPVPAIRKRAALAAGRIGDEKAVAGLSTLLSGDKSSDVRAMAAFALGEIESIKGADAILKVLNDPASSVAVRARAAEAAGKIVAANPKAAESKSLGEAILKTLDEQNRPKVKPSRETVLLGLTAAARASVVDPKRRRPDDTDFLTAEFLKSPDGRVRADAANTLARLRSNQANLAVQKILTSDLDPVARANAARALSAAADVKTFDLLVKSATEDADLRVRVSAMSALASLKNPKAADKLLYRGEKLLTAYKISKFAHPVETNELIMIAAVLGRLIPDSGNERAVKFLDELVKLDDAHTPEISIARMRVKPGDFTISPTALKTSWGLITTAQVGAVLAATFPRTAEIQKMRTAAPILLRRMADRLSTPYSFAAPTSFLATTDGRSTPYADEDKKNLMAAPEFIRAFAQFKTKDLDAFLRARLANNDVFVRTAAAELMAERPTSKENVTALQQAFEYAHRVDKEYNDARLAIMDALYKLDKKEAAKTLQTAINSADYLTRKKAIDLLSDKELQKLAPDVTPFVEKAIARRTNRVFPYTPAYVTKLGQMMSTKDNYIRAVSRKNGIVKAVVKTEKGTFTIDFYPEDAPLTVDNFIKLARADYFNGVEVHRVVPNFVMQDGDPRGDGNGGPGWSIRCEINARPFDRGAVGMALSGKDTGGSQWFVTHSPQPHLDGGYTVFGQVNEIGMKVVDNIVHGDKIISIKIVGEKAPPVAPKPKTEEPVEEKGIPVNGP
jgi:cyclophilin family peptidyl-prolyl cis-trans isomerase/HEAT repeat protein